MDGRYKRPQEQCAQHSKVSGQKRLGVRSLVRIARRRRFGSLRDSTQQRQCAASKKEKVPGGWAAWDFCLAILDLLFRGDLMSPAVKRVLVSPQEPLAVLFLVLV